MRVYLASPNNQLQSVYAADHPVLLSFGLRDRYGEWLGKGYAASFSRLLLDSGAFSAMNSGATIDLSEYAEWASRFRQVDAVAGLDSILGDSRQSLRNYEAGIGFPTMHDTDGDALLDELIPIAKERGGWIGIGIKPNPTRAGREDWLRRTLDRIPDDLHVHGWALRAYSHLTRFDSFDSTEWWRSAMRIRRDLGDWLTYGEALDLSIKRIMRTARIPEKEAQPQKELPL